MSTLLYGSESWTTYSHQENRLNSFHLRSLRRILHISWRDHITNVDVLKQAGLPSMHALLSQRRLRWLGHVHRMQDGRIPKDVLYGELAEGSRPTGRPALRFKDVCKRDMKNADINTNTWETIAADRSAWRHAIREGSTIAEGKKTQKWSEKRERRKVRVVCDQLQPPAYVCNNCNRDCHSRIGLHSHSRRCQTPN